MKKNIKSGLLLAGTAIIISASCTVRGHKPPGPPPPVIKIGQIEKPTPINEGATTYVIQPVNKASEGIPK